MYHTHKGSSAIKPYFYKDYYVYEHMGCYYVDLHKSAFDKYIILNSFANGYENSAIDNGIENNNHPLVKLNLARVRNKQNLNPFIESFIEVLDEYVSMVKFVDNDKHIEINLNDQTINAAQDILDLTNTDQGQRFCLLYNVSSLIGESFNKYIDFFKDHQHSVESVSETLTISSVKYYTSPTFPYAYHSSPNVVVKLEDILGLYEGFDEFVAWFYLLRGVFFDLSYNEASKVKDETKTLQHDGLPLSSNSEYLTPAFYVNNESHISLRGIIGLLKHNSEFGNASIYKMLKGLTAMTALSLYENNVIEFFLNRIIENVDEESSVENDSHSKNSVFKALLNEMEQQKLSNMIVGYFELPEMKNSSGAKWMKVNKKNINDLTHVAATIILGDMGAKAIDQYGISSRDHINLTYLTINMPSHFYTFKNISELVNLYDVIKFDQNYEKYMEAVDLYIEQECKIPATLCLSMIGR